MKKGERYENPYLTEVIVRINFSTILALSGNNESAAEDFRKNIFEQYPIALLKKNHEVNIGLNIQSDGFNQINQRDKIIWEFKNKEDNKKIELSDSYVLLTYTKEAYTNFRYLLQDIILILDALKKYSPINPHLLQLRYINQLSGKSIEELTKCINKPYFNEEIIDLNGKDTFVQNLSRLTITEGKYLLNTQYGLFNLGYPNPNFEKNYILDFDCSFYNIESMNQINEELKEMNYFIWKQFQLAITDKLKKEMKGELDE